jgi:hypothetical protein
MLGERGTSYQYWVKEVPDRKILVDTKMENVTRFEKGQNKVPALEIW